MADPAGMDRTPDALQADYAAAGFGGVLRPGVRPLLLLIDFARAYFDPESPLCAGVEDARASAARVHAAARAAGVPVMFTRVEYGPDGEGGGLFWHKVAAVKAFVRGNPLGDFTPELAPLPGDDVLTKHFPSAFFGTGLAEHLHARGIDTLIITGLSTSGCVRATAVDALCHGFVPLVVRDAVGDRDAAVHAANLFDIAAKSAEVIGEGDVLDYIAALKA